MVQKRRILPICLIIIIFIFAFFVLYNLSKERGFTIIVLPDTQTYSKDYPEVFSSQTQWIAENKENLNIQFVIHEGDLVNDKDNENQWKRANESMWILDKNNIPYSVVRGNHDKSTEFYNIYFPVSRFSDKGWWGGNYNNNTNNYQLLTIQNQKFLFISLDACPDTGEINWADSVLNFYSDRKAILTTHGYLNESAERNVHVCGNTKYIWEMIKKHENLQMVFSGHVHAEARRIDFNDAGKPVYQMLADYQTEEGGKSGYLRILTFSKDKIYVTTYSSYSNKYKTGNESQFVIDNEIIEPPAVSDNSEKIRAFYAYSWLTNSAIDTSLTNGINTFIVKYGYFGTFVEEAKSLATSAKTKGFSFVPAINTAQTPSPSTTLEKGVYYNGSDIVESGFVPPLSRAYWGNLTEKVKALAELSNNPSYRIDGVMLDFELYDINYVDEKSFYFTYNSSFDTETFNEFVQLNSLSGLNPPITEARKFERYQWLKNYALLDRYTIHVKQKAVDLTDKMEKEVHAINPDFIISSYPSPYWDSEKYAFPLFFEFFKGWQGTNPATLFATDTYGYGYKLGKDYLSPELSQNGDYFYFTRRDTGEKISMYYVSGALLRYYSPLDFPKIKEMSDKTNGHWLFSISSIDRICSGIPNSYFRPRVNCDLDSRSPGCCKNQWSFADSNWNSECCPYFEQAKQEYWDAVKSVSQN